MVAWTGRLRLEDKWISEKLARSEEAREILGHLVGKCIDGLVAEFGERFVGDDDICWVIDRRAVGGFAKRETVALGRGGFHGGIGLDEEAIGGDRAEVFETCGVAGGEPLDVERKVGAEIDEGFD